MGNWRGGNEPGTLYRVREFETDRVGADGTRWREGDLLLVVRHSGDCFYDYRRVRIDRKGSIKCTGKTCGYALGLGVRIPIDVYHLLMAGKSLRFKKKWFNDLMTKLDKAQEKIERECEFCEELRQQEG